MRACGNPGLFGGRVGRLLDLANETVAAAWNSFDELGIGCRVTEGFAELIDGIVEAVVAIELGVGRPERLVKLFTGHDCVGAPDEGGQHVEGLFAEAEAMGAAAQVETRGVKGKTSKASDTRGRFGLWAWVCRPFSEDQGGAESVEAKPDGSGAQ